MASQGKQIGQAGMAFFKGIPGGITVTWKGRDGATSRVASIFTSFNKGRNADVAKTFGNKGEFLSARRRNLRQEVRISCKPVGAGETTAFAIADDPPAPMDLVTVAGAADTTMNHAFWMVDGKPDVSYSPEGDAVITMSIEAYLDDTGAAISIAALPDAS